MKKKKDFVIEPKISIDTRYVSTAEKSIQLGVDWINDVTGLNQPSMRSLLAESKMDCVMMHHIKIPEDRSHHLSRHQDPTALVLDWATKQIDLSMQSGINKNNIIFDPGIGFGKLADQSLEVLQNINMFQQLGLRLLVGHSRKTFMSLITNKAFKDRDIETNAISLHLANNNIDYIRVHNAHDTSRTFRSHYAMQTDKY
jgi:dihydropteroate synthase